MNPKDEESIDREAWRRQLGDAGAPSSFTDAHIRAEARRALTPRIGRWWLPASLAASLMLAVFVVQWQVEEGVAPQVVIESDVAPHHQTAPMAEPEPLPSVAPMAEIPVMEAEPPRRRNETRERSMPQDAAREDAFVPAPAAAESRAATGALVVPQSMVADQRTPEQWYADIEALRAAGRNAEADAELARLEAAHPGWLERHLSKAP